MIEKKKKKKKKWACASHGCENKRSIEWKKNCVEKEKRRNKKKGERIEQKKSR